MARAEATRRHSGQRTILFVDEIHRFNKAQQDAFLPYVEAGTIVLIGATTENPSFEVNAALLSRSKVFVLEALTVDEVVVDPDARAHRRDARPRRRADRRRRRRAVGHRRHRQRRRAGGAEPAGTGGAVRAASSRTAAPHHPGLARTRAAAPDPALRQERRGALQPDLGAAQVDAQQRSRRGGLLARPHARSRRGSAVRRAAPGALRLRGHRQRRPAGADRRGRRAAGGALHRDARRQHGAGAGRDLSGHGARRATPSTSPTTAPPRTPSARWPSRCRCTCGTRRRS